MPHYGYKTLVTEDGKLCFAVLQIPDDALTNEARSNIKVREKAKFRCSKATVIDIHDLNGNQIAEAYSQYEEKIKYVIGQTVESEFDPNINELCRKGIHYFLSEVIYVLNPEKSKYTGSYTGYWENGQIEREGNYVDGKKNGRFVEYCRSGEIERQENYVDGKLHGICVWYHKNGQIQEQGNYIDGKREGRCVCYYQSGQIGEELNYVDGKLHGRHVCYYESGQIRKELSYVDGKLVK